MSGQYSHYGKSDRYDYDKQKKILPETDSGKEYSIQRERDADLIIDDNTIYEIDRECFERMKKQKRRRE